MNVLLINQLVIDLLTCLALVVTYGTILSRIELSSGTLGYWLCSILISEQCLWICMDASIISMTVITIERYIKIVHSIWHKNHSKPWIAKTACAFCWLSGLAWNFAPYALTTVVIDGQCLPLTMWSSERAQSIFGYGIVLYHFHFPMVVFVFCFTRIIQVIRRQNRILHRQNPASSSVSAVASQTRQASSHRQSNIIRTIILLTGFLAITSLPVNAYYLYLTGSKSIPVNELWYPIVFVALFNPCANPLIFIFSYDNVRRFLKQKLVSVKLKLENSNSSTTV